MSEVLSPVNCVNTIYFDMDGVLCDWVAEFENTVKLKIEEFNALTKDEVDEIKRKFITPDFFARLKPIERGMNMIRAMIDLDNVKVKILSAVGDNSPDDVERVKRDWLKNNGLGDIEAIFVRKVMHKVEFADPNAILVDDRHKIVKGWSEAGGIAWHFK